MAKGVTKKGLFDGIPVVREPAAKAVMPTTGEKEAPIQEGQDNEKAADTDTRQEKAVSEITEEKKKPERERAAAEEEEEEKDVIVSAGSFRFQKKEREKKTVHKGFLITESMNKKYKALAKKLNMNENQLFESILDQIFSEEGI